MENHKHNFQLKEVEHSPTGSVHTRTCSCGDTQSEHRDKNGLLVSLSSRSKMNISDAMAYFANDPVALKRLKAWSGKSC